MFNCFQRCVTKPAKMVVSVLLQVNVPVDEVTSVTAVSWIWTSVQVICIDVITLRPVSICLDGIIAAANLVTVVIFTTPPEGLTAWTLTSAMIRHSKRDTPVIRLPDVLTLMVDMSALVLIKTRHSMNAV